MFRNLLARSFYAFNAADPGSGGAGNSGGEPTPPPAVLPPVAPPAEPPKAAEGDDIKKQLEALSAEMKAKAKELEKYKAKEQEEIDRQKTVETKLAEKEAEVAALKRTTLIEKIRREGGFTDKVYDSVNVTGDTEDEIKTAYASYKTALDEYIKSTGAKPAQGGGTEAGKPDGKNAGGANVPYLVRIGMVGNKGKAG